MTGVRFSAGQGRGIFSSLPGPDQLWSLSPLSNGYRRVLRRG